MSKAKTGPLPVAKKISVSISSSGKNPAQPAAPLAKKNATRATVAKSAGLPSEPTINRWTFLSNHAHVLIALYSDPDVILREVALQVGITERGVQRIVQDLEDEGFIHREKIGRKNHYQVLVDQPLRHPLEAHRNIGDLLRLVSG